MRTELEILREAKRLAVEYYKVTGRPLGITGEVAEFEAAERLQLELAPPRAEGFDALRKSETAVEKIQIKGRRRAASNTWGRVPSINTEKEFDFVVLVLLSPDYETEEMWQASKESVLSVLDRPGSKARNERRSMSVNQFKAIACRIWP